MLSVKKKTLNENYSEETPPFLLKLLDYREVLGQHSNYIFYTMFSEALFVPIQSNDLNKQTALIFLCLPIK